MSFLGNSVQRDLNIDLLFSSESIMERMNYEQKEDTWGSDHFPIIFELGIRKINYNKKTNQLSTKKNRLEKILFNA